MKARDGRPVTVIMGLLGAKDAQGVLAPFRELDARMIFTGFDAGAAMPPDALVSVASELGISAQSVPDVVSAMQVATAAGAAPSHILICGSLYLAGEALALSELTWPR